MSKKEEIEGIKEELSKINKKLDALLIAVEK